MPPQNTNVPVDVVLKAIVDKSGSQPVKDFLGQYLNATKEAEESVSRTSQLLDRMGSQMGHLMDPFRQSGGLVGMAGVGAIYHQYLQATTYGAQAALAQGNVTGGSQMYQPYTQSLLGVQAKTGVHEGDVEAGLRTVAQMAGSSLSPEGAGRFGALLAGASLTSGLSAQAVSQIVGSFLQSSGMSAGVGGGMMGTANATALMAGVSQALGAFPGSQKEAILPAVAGLYGAQALGAGSGGPASGAVQMASFANLMASANPLFRNLQNLEAGAGAIGGAIQGSITSGPMLAIMHAAGLGFKEIREGFTPGNAVKLAQGLQELWPEPEARSVREFQLFGPAGTKELEEIQRVGPSKWMAMQRRRGVSVPAYQREMEQAILAHTPEASLSKTQAGLEKGLFGNSLVQWIGSSPVHMALGGAGAALGWQGLKFGAGAALSSIRASASGLASSGIDGLAVGAGDIVAGGITAGILPSLISLIAPGSSLDMLGQVTGGGLGSSKAQQALGLKSYEALVVQEAIRRGGGTSTMENYVRRHGGKATAEGVVPGGSPTHMLGALHEALGVQKVPQVLREVESKFGSGYWHMDKHGEEASQFIRERLSGKGLTAISELMKEERKYNALGPQGYWASKQNESVTKFSEAVDRFSKSVEGGNKNAAYTGPVHAGAMGVSFVQGALGSSPGMVLAAYLGGGRTGGAVSGTSSAAGVIPASYYSGTNMNSAWDKVLHEYSGGSYGLSYVESLAASHPSGGAHSHDRKTVEADARKYGIPFNILWGIYGAESSWGKAASSFGLTGQFPGTGTSGNFSTDARMSAEDLQKLFEKLHLNVHVTLDGKKQRQHNAKIHAVRT